MAFELSQQRYHHCITRFSQYRCLTVGVLLARGACLGVARIHEMHLYSLYSMITYDYCS